MTNRLTIGEALLYLAAGITGVAVSAVTEREVSQTLGAALLLVFWLALVLYTRSHPKDANAPLPGATRTLGIGLVLLAALAMFGPR